MEREIASRKASQARDGRKFPEMGFPKRDFLLENSKRKRIICRAHTRNPSYEHEEASDY